MNADDPDFIARVLAHDDRQAFGTLVRRHQSTVHNFLRRLTGGQHALAEDLAQDTFIEAYRHLDRFRGGSAFSTWLLGIAYNRFRSERRRQRDTAEWTGDLAECDLLAGSVATTTPVSVDLQQDLAAALEHLPGPERSAVHLCYAEGLTHEEAAWVLGCPLGTVKTLVLRAKAKLRDALRVWAPI